LPIAQPAELGASAFTEIGKTPALAYEGKVGTNLRYPLDFTMDLMFKNNITRIAARPELAVDRLLNWLSSCDKTH
jgi:hypothetical protein